MEPETSLRDDMLRLIFTCCHPALSREAQVALSLRTLARVEVRPSPAPSWCLRPPWPSAWYAGPRQDRHRPHPLRDPLRCRRLTSRLAGVLAVVYLIAADAPTGGDAVARVDLEAEAIRLARLLASLMPGEPEALHLAPVLLSLGPHPRPHRRRR